ncbi:MAG: hypothetical protein ACRD2T_01125 [Thermoanaerobaculia bacterium]
MQREAMRKRVYIETTIPSFFFETRSEPEMLARRAWTVAWWMEQRQHYELVTSLAVVEELQQGGHPQKEQALDLAGVVRSCTDHPRGATALGGRFIVKADPAIEEIRVVRHRISEEFGLDTRALLDHYRELEKHHSERMLRAGGARSSEVEARRQPD